MIVDNFVCGDLNRFIVNLLCRQLDLVNKVMTPTHEDSILDNFLGSTTIDLIFNVSVNNPIANCDHNSLFCVPLNNVKCKMTTKKILYDMRDFRVADFVSHVSAINWNLLMCSSSNVNDKCRIFHETIYECMVNCIPRIDVLMTDSDPLGSLLSNI